MMAANPNSVKVDAPTPMLKGGYTSVEDAFPSANPNYRPVGSKVLVQIRTPKKKSSGGILLVEDTQETDKWNTQVGKVISVGPVAFCNRETLAPWPEGAWIKVGEFARVPKYGGDRWHVAVTPDDPNTEYALFAVFRDLDIVGEVPDPLSVIAFI
jgi:co-chaperonin GroES (HSP10)